MEKEIKMKNCEGVEEKSRAHRGVMVWRAEQAVFNETAGE